MKRAPVRAVNTVERPDLHPAPSGRQEDRIPAGSNYLITEVRFKVQRNGRARGRRLQQPDDVAHLAQQLIPDDAREHFGVFLLDAQLRLVAWHVVTVGTLSSTTVHPREVFGPALRCMGVAGLVLVHNHPSGDATPSADDRKLTRELVEGAKLLQLTLHDHVVIGNGTGSWCSMAQLDLL